MREKITIPGFFLFMCSVILLGGCNQPFNPIKEDNTVPLSIYGFLDASADTQWVRVTPIRDQISQTLEKPEMKVTLEDLETGNTSTLSDSLFQFRQGFNVINAWTTMDLEPDKTYRLTAKRPDGATSRVTVTTPRDFPTPKLYDYGDGCTALMRIEGLAGLADIQSVWHVRIIYRGVGGVIDFEEERTYRFLHRDRVTRVGEGAYEVHFDTNREFNQIRNQQTAGSNQPAPEVRVLSRTLFIASGGPEWDPKIKTLDDITYALPEGISNVENGLGYMVGIVSKTIPYETCFDYLN